jgi:hypothetical protein
MLFTLFMKNNPNTPKFFGFLIAVVIIIVSFAIFTFQTNNQTAEPSTSNTPNIVSQNNITMQLISAHTEGSNGYRVEVCYNLPDQRDWLLTYPKSPLGTMFNHLKKVQCIGSTTKTEVLFKDVNIYFLS